MGQTVQFRIMNSLLSVTLQELAMKARKRHTISSSFNKAGNVKTDVNPNEVQIAQTCSEYMGLNLYEHFR